MSPLTEQSRPQYASPSPVKMKLFQQPVPGTKTPSFIPPPSKKLENGLKTEDINTPKPQNPKFANNIKRFV